jgi:Zn-dependent protease
VHSDALEKISTNARLLEGQSQFRAAHVQWSSALTMLPPDAQQRLWIQSHLADLERNIHDLELARGEKREHPWLKKLGPLAPLVVLLGKAKGLLVIFKFKFIFSLFAFVAFYSAIFGPSFGIGFAVLILCHEMGHFVEVKRNHLSAELPVFLPGFGAYVKWQGMGVSMQTRSLIALAGPMAGLLSAAACLGIHAQTHNELWLALARSGAWLNLLNLIPVWALDGGHAIQALNRIERTALMTIAILLCVGMSDPLYFFVALGAGYQAFFTNAPKEGNTGIALYFAGLLLALGAILYLAPGHGFGLN